MVRWILVAVLTIGIAGTAFWGYQEHQEKNAVLIQAENTYQRSFHELSYNIDLLHDKIGTTLAMNSKQRLSPQMVDIWRITSDALSNVGQLPLGLLPFNKTEEFLSDIGDFTYRTAVRDLDSNPLSDKEKQSFEDLYKQSGKIKDELRQVQHITLKNNLRWMDVQLALANQDEQTDNTIIDGLKTVEKTVEGYSETNVDSGLMGTSTKDHQFKHLQGDKISESEALKKAKSLFNVKDNNNITVTKSGDGSDIPTYSVSYRNGDENAYMDMAEQGGHPLTLLVDRPVQDKQISLNDGQDKAKAYLDKLDFENMTIFQSDEFDNIGVYSFLYNQDGVRVHSDAIEVKVALDNGDILGLTARNYFMNHTDRDIPKPEISKEEAEDMVNPDVKIQEDFLAVIDNDLGEEVLAYEFLGTLGNETYRIFINAMDGKEEKVEKLGGTEINFAGNF
ncbi:spore germination protein [Virgibacillus halotolerans]|uniref:germination protein YpeB n=1 Tax=Virgibacillus halotolerans TaxID=1071053 RepID=UPI001960319C|nr:germination protein YpeB [Virgibacillus halotolerans]MBM7598343.1 spore germination protein [Virgibacillus halotolerans]